MFSTRSSFTVFMQWVTGLATIGYFVALAVNPVGTTDSTIRFATYLVDGISAGAEPYIPDPPVLPTATTITPAVIPIAEQGLPPIDAASVDEEHQP